MPLPVSLKDLSQELDLVNQECRLYINKNTGDYYMLRQEEIDMIDDDDDSDFVPEWQREEIVKAKEILESKDWLALPDSWDIHMYRIMQKFCYSVNDPKARNMLLNAISGRGAFRMFRNEADRLGITEDWYRYKEQALADIAEEFLKIEGIAYVDDMP